MIFGIKKELPVLTILTAIGYISCFTFQFGILLNYGIPNDLASVDINSLLFSIFMVTLLSLFFVLPAILFNSFIDKEVKIGKVIIFGFLIANVITAYFISSGVLGYYNYNYSDYYGLTIFAITFVSVILLQLLIFGAIYAQKKIKKHHDDYQKIIPRNLPWLLVAMMLVFIPGIIGTFYAKVNMATSFYKNTDYFFVLENSKGIIVVSCNEKNGVSYKRVKSDEASFSLNYNADIKIKVKECLSKWDKEQRKIVKL